MIKYIEGGSYARQTRALIKDAMRENGWKRIRTWCRPKHRQQILVAQEWIDRKHGTTDQFMTSYGTYDESTDSVDLGADGWIVKTMKLTDFHWWTPIAVPDEFNTLHLHVANTVRGMPFRAGFA